MTKGKKNLVRATIEIATRLEKLNPERDPSQGIILSMLSEALYERLIEILETDEPKAP